MENYKLKQAKLKVIAAGCVEIVNNIFLISPLATEMKIISYS